MASGFPGGFGAFGADGITRTFARRLILYGTTANMPMASARYRHHLYIIEDASPGTQYQPWFCKFTGNANGWQWLAVADQTVM